MRTHRNGTLEQAMALLLNNQAAFVAQLSETHKWRAGMESRVARIEQSLEEIKTVLVRHERILTELPDAVRRKIGFKPK